MSADLTVRVDRIGDEGLDFEEGLPVEWLVKALGANSPYKPAEAGSISAHIDKVEQVVHVRGRVRIALAGECVRCLTPVPLALDLPVEVALFPRGEEPPAAPDGEVASDDLGVATYEEDEIDLADVVHDEVFLELPMNVVCSESCAGLCPRCGQNLNEGRCSCAPEADPRWEALRGIKLSS